MAEKDRELADLRTRAEERVISAERQNTDRMSPEDIAKLIHELETHQIELEIQNEGDCSEFCVNVKTLDPSDHRSSAASSRPSKKMANCDRVRFQF